VATEAPTADPGRPQKTRRYTHLVFRAPSAPVSAVALVVVSGLLAAIAWLPGFGLSQFTVDLALVFLLPGFAAAALTPSLAAAFGGRLKIRRSLLLALTADGIGLPLLLAGRLLGSLPHAPAVPVVGLLLLIQGPSLWLRHMSLFGISNPSHSGSVLPSALQPALTVVAVLAVFGVTTRLVLVAGVFLFLGFVSAALLLRAADRPLQREFGVSGVSLLRPMFDHINLRDPAATDALEGFFRRSAIPADLRVTLVEFRTAGGTKATIALPTVHPGPFAALGGSDLPRKLAERLGPKAGTVIVPHTPCNHDLDLPTGAEVERVAAAAQTLLAGLVPSTTPRVGPLVLPYPTSIARAQAIGDAVVVLVTQAPAPTDDIDYAVVDRLVRENAAAGGPLLAVIDAHNSYVEDRGDITYGTPVAERLLTDSRAAIRAAIAQSVYGSVDVGVAVRSAYSIGEHGIGPAGIRALVVRGGGTSTAYVLIDGNNLLLGLRAPILEGLRDLVDAAEVMTTDNHVVHEVDGSINAIGEKYPVERLTADVRAAVQQAIVDLGPVSVASGTVEIPEVPVLGPDATARLLTSLSDTFSMFSNAFLMTFLFLIASSTAVLLAVL
jgi:putative membrane protein